MKTVIFNFFYTPTALSDYGKFPANLPDDIAIITKNQKESQMKPIYQSLAWCVALCVFAGCSREYLQEQDYLAHHSLASITMLKPSTSDTRDPKHPAANAQSTHPSTLDSNPNRTKDAPMPHTPYPNPPAPALTLRKFALAKPKAKQILHKNTLIYTNQNPEAALPPSVSFGDVLEFYTTPVANAKPPKPLPMANESFHHLAHLPQSPKTSIVWLGHSSLYVVHNGLHILIDPLFTSYASPVWFVNRAFKAHKTYKKEDFPRIDIVLITHSHYDHLDKKTLKSLKSSASYFIVPQGSAQILIKYKIPREKIIELNWWEGVRSAAHSLRITATPAQHNTKRLGYAANTSLWVSYALELGDKKVFVSGDGGYYTHFREIGEFFGSFDLALLENGQYNKAWQYSHSFPEQTIRAAQDLRAKVVQPIHWGRFSAGTHAWNEPVDILKQLAQIAGIGYNVPQIGEVYYLGDEPKNTLWYRF